MAVQPLLAWGKVKWPCKPCHLRKLKWLHNPHRLGEINWLCDPYGLEELKCLMSKVVVSPTV